MKSFALFFLLGLVACFWLPQDWQLAVALGWGATLVVETWLHHRRQQVMQDGTPPRQLLLTLVIGFLGRLSLLFVGALVGAFSNWYSPGIFLGAALAAVVVGEVLSLPPLMRATRRGRNSSPDEPTHSSS